VIVDHNIPLTRVSFGPAVVALLVPQRPPYLMVDRIVGVALEPTPTLAGCRYVSANEPVLAGHFPDHGIWPGALTLEGLGQAANALSTLVTLVRSWTEAGSSPDEVLQELRNIELGATLNAGHDPARATRFRERLHSRPEIAVPLGGSAQVRFHKPVFPGCRLDYQVWLTRVMGELRHFVGEVEVDGELVAEATLGTSRVSFPLSR